MPGPLLVKLPTLPLMPPVRLMLPGAAVPPPTWILKLPVRPTLLPRLNAWVAVSSWLKVTMPVVAKLTLERVAALRIERFVPVLSEML